MTRSPRRAPKLTEVETVRGDFAEPATLKDAFAGVSTAQYLFAAGLPCTVLRDVFYIDMFLEKFDAEGVVRGPARQGCGAFVSREDGARTAAAVLRRRPGGIYDVTGPEALSVAEIARRLSTLAGRQLRMPPAVPATFPTYHYTAF